MRADNQLKMNLSTNQNVKHLIPLAVFQVMLLVSGLFSAQAGDFQWLRTAGGSGAEVSRQIVVDIEGNPQRADCEETSVN